MKKINKEQITQIRIIDFYPARWYKLLSEKKLFGFIIKKAGIYNDCVSLTYIGIDPPKNHTIIEGHLYENPEVVIHLSDRSQHHKSFISMEDAKSWVNQEFNGWKYLELNPPKT